MSHSYAVQSTASNQPNPNSSTSTVSAPMNTQKGAVDDLARIFNTALVATQVHSAKDFSSELHQLVKSPAFNSILNAVRQYARLEGVTERQAAEQIIQTFRKIDQLWSEYVFQEGVDRLKNRLPG